MIIYGLQKDLKDLDRNKPLNFNKNPLNTIEKKHEIYITDLKLRLSLDDRNNDDHDD